MAWFLSQIAVVAGVAPVAFLGCLKISLVTRSLLWFAVLAGLATLAGLAARRIKPLRVAGAAWSAGLGIGVVFVLMVAAYSAMT